jgi:hypothetical protein
LLTFLTGWRLFRPPNLHVCNYPAVQKIPRSFLRES